MTCCTTCCTTSVVPDRKPRGAPLCWLTRRANPLQNVRPTATTTAPPTCAPVPSGWTARGTARACRCATGGALPMGTKTERRTARAATTCAVEQGGDRGALPRSQACNHRNHPGRHRHLLTWDPAARRVVLTWGPRSTAERLRAQPPGTADGCAVPWQYRGTSSHAPGRAAGGPPDAKKC